MEDKNLFAILSLCVWTYANGVAIPTPVREVLSVDPGIPIAGDPPKVRPPIMIDRPIIDPPIIDPPIVRPPIMIDPPIVRPPIMIDPPMVRPPIMIDPPMVRPPISIDPPIIDPPIIDPPLIDPPKPIKPVRPPTTGSQEPLDLAFIMDTTGSMASYIKIARENIQQVVDQIVQNSRSEIRFALVEYRDHPPAEKSFITRTNDFTSSVRKMRTWLNNAQARGGGDTPEAISDALYAGTTLSWRPKAVKIAVLVSDAPPHGLMPHLDSSFPNGFPGKYDVFEMTEKLKGKGVTLYTVGCEPAISQYKDLFQALAFKASGQYIPLADPDRLIEAIIGSAKEEMSLQGFSADVQREIEKQTAAGGAVDNAQIAQTVYDQLSSRNAQTTQLLRNNKTLEGPSSGAKEIAAASSMAEARKVFKKGSAPIYSRDFSVMRPSHRFREMTRKGDYSGIRKFSDMFATPYDKKESVPRSSGIRESVSASRMESAPMTSSGLRGRSGASRMAMEDVASSGGAGKETYTAVKSAVTLEQIKRLVNKEAAKVKTGA